MRLLVRGLYWPMGWC